jgi:hypothetical protein
MEAHANAKLRYDGFLLDERRLQRLASTITDRLRKASIQSNVEFDVYRSDHAKLRTGELKELLSEPNTPASRIERIVLSLSPDEPIQVTLDFEVGRGVSVTLAGQDRDLVLLLSGDLKNYIEHEIAKKRSVIRHLTSPKAGWLGFLALMALYPFIRDAIPTEYNRQGKQYEADLAAYEKAAQEHKDLVTKAQHELNQLADDTRTQVQALVPSQGDREGLSEFLVAHIERQLKIEDGGAKLRSLSERAPEPPVWHGSNYGFNANNAIGYFGMVAVVIVMIVVQQLVIGLEEPYLFLIGDEIAEYALRSKRRERILWGVGATLVLGVLSSIIGSIVWPPK